MKINIFLHMESKFYGILAITIIIAFSVGFTIDMYDIVPTKTIKNLVVSQEIIHSQNYDNDVFSLINVVDNNSKNKIKNDLNQFIWKKNSLPDDIPTLIEKDIIDSKYSNMKNLKTIDKFTIEMEHDVNSIIYFFKPMISNDKLIIYHQGHRGDFYEGKETIEYFLEKNYSVAAFSMPLLGMNSQPIIDNKYLGKIKLQSHNQFELLENDDFTPIKFFIEPIIISNNYFDNNYNFDSYYMIGISGGGWTATLAAAIDDRISQTYSIAGSYPIFLRSEPENFGDYEQHHLELYEKSNYLDLYTLASIGDNRKFIQIFNKYDPCCFSGEAFQEYEDIIKKTVDKLGSGTFDIYLDDTHKEHIISVYALELIIDEING